MRSRIATVILAVCMVLGLQAGIVPRRLHRAGRPPRKEYVTALWVLVVSAVVIGVGVEGIRLIRKKCRPQNKVSPEDQLAPVIGRFRTVSSQSVQSQGPSASQRSLKIDSKGSLSPSHRSTSDRGMRR